MHKVHFGNIDKITKFSYNATNDGVDEVGGELNFTDFTSLTECQIQYSKLDTLNFLTTFMDSTGNNTIEKLSCTRNDFYNIELPSTIPNYTSLTNINLSNSGIKGTLFDINYLTSLKTLRLEGNIWGGFEGASSWRGKLLTRHSIATTRFDLGTTGYTGLTAVASGFQIPDTLEQLHLNMNGFDQTACQTILEACVNQDSIAGNYSLTTVNLSDQANGGNTLNTAANTAKTELESRGTTVLIGNKTTGDGVLI
tara:strand:- start:416 stop:1174 length:759 start_codon:yes stop_codon:yes gene_type:complete